MTDRINQLKSMLEAEPNDVFCMYGIAMEYAKTSDWIRAIEWFDRTIEADPNYCYAYFHKAKVLEQAGKIADAQVTLRTGLERARTSGDTHALSEISAFLEELS